MHHCGVRSEIYAYLVLTGRALVPAEVTTHLGVLPDRTVYVGQVTNERTGRRAEGGRWELHSGLPLSADLEAHVDAVLRRLEPLWPALVGVAQSDSGVRVTLECVVTSFGGARPAISFRSEVVRRLAEVGGEIDVDLYVLSGGNGGGN